MKYVFILLLALLSFPAYADQSTLKDVAFRQGDIDELSQHYLYLGEDQKSQAEFEQKFPDATPLTVKTFKFRPRVYPRDYIVLLENSSMLCGKDCPLKIFDITNPKKPMMILELVTSPPVKIRDCGNGFAFLFKSQDNSWTSWIPGNQKFKPDNSYATLDDATKCEKTTY